jgi:hypothetical protein
MVFALMLRLLGAHLWAQDPRQLGLKIAIGLIVVAPTPGLLYRLTPVFVIA